MPRITRRDFLRTTGCTAAGLAAASLSRFGLVNAYAQGTDYKALVCIFLLGGNDANNMIIPYDSSNYQNYAQIRANLALPQSDLLPIQPESQGLPYAFHPKFVDMQNLFNGGHLAAVVNTGTLVQPTTRDQFLNRQVGVPVSLFSHYDQQQQMQTDVVRYTTFPNVGWGGLVADQIQVAYGSAQFPIMVSLAGNSVFAQGLVAPSLQTGIDPTAGLTGFSGSPADDARMSAFQSLLTFEDGLTLVQAASTATSNAIQNAKTLGAAMAQAPALKTAFPRRALLVNSYRRSQKSFRCAPLSDCLAKSSSFPPSVSTLTARS